MNFSPLISNNDEYSKSLKEIHIKRYRGEFLIVTDKKY